MRNKIKRKAKQSRKNIILIILLLDVLLLCRIAQIPYLFSMYKLEAVSVAIRYSIIDCIIGIITNQLTMSVFIILQVMVLTIIYAIWTWTYKINNEIEKNIDLDTPKQSGNGQYGTSRFQTNYEKKINFDIWNDDAKQGGVVFGMEKEANRENIYYDGDDTHTLIIGSTRSGKTRKIILPTIWVLANASESMVITDLKGEIYITVADFLIKKGYNVILHNYRDTEKSNKRINILHNAITAYENGDIPEMVEIAEEIAEVMTPKSTNRSDPIWEAGEKAVIAGLILLVVMEAPERAQKNMSSVINILVTLGVYNEDGCQLINYINSLEKNHPARMAFSPATIASGKTRASFFASVLADIRIYGSEKMAFITSNQDYDMQEIGKKKTAVFLIIPDEKNMYNKLAALQITMIYQELIILSNIEAERVPKRVNFLLDEFGNIPTIPYLIEKITAGAGRGIKFIMAVQAIEQIREKYGDFQSKIILANTLNKIYLITADLETAKYVSEILGQYTVENESESNSLQKQSVSLGSGRNLIGRALLTPDELMRWKNKSVVIRARMFPSIFDIPDLSKYRANTSFGMTNDTKINQSIKKYRWMKVEKINADKVITWIPILITKEKKNDEVKDIL